MVWCPDPTLSRGKGLMTIECFLGCAKSIVLIFEQADDYVVLFHWLASEQHLCDVVLLVHNLLTQHNQESAQ